MIDINIASKFSKKEQEIVSIIKKVAELHNSEARLVGGFVRDKLMDLASNDIDVMTYPMDGASFAEKVIEYLKQEYANEPELLSEVKNPATIKKNPAKSKHLETATVIIPLRSGEKQELDFAGSRAEVYHGDSRIPVIEGATPQEDALRRDLTINALFYNINYAKIEDFTGQGIRDLITHSIRTPVDPLKTFKDDPLRIFRVIRFASRYGWEIDPDTFAAMKDPSIIEDINNKVSKERIQIELSKTFKGPNPTQALNILKDTGIFQNIMNEALRGTEYKGKMAPLDMDQNNPHHELTVWDHTVEVVKNILDFYPESMPEKRLLMVLSAIMHDLGKLYYDIHQDKGDRTGYGGHEMESKNIAEHIMRYLKFENTLIDQVMKMARHHMRPHAFTEGEVAGARAMRKFLRKMGEDSLDWVDVMNHAIADAYSKSKDAISPAIVATYANLEKQLREALASMAEVQKGSDFTPILNGNEIMNILGISPGPWMSDMTEFIKELMDENPSITKEEATQKLQDQYKNFKIPKWGK